MNLSDRLTRSQKRAIRTRRAIMRSAQTLFARNGFNQVTIADVTDLADVALGSFYNYFDNRDHIIDAVLQDTSESQERFHLPVSVQLEDCAEGVIIARFVSTAHRCQLDPVWADLAHQATLIERWPLPEMLDQTRRNLVRLPDSDSLHVEADLNTEYAERLIIAVTAMLFDSSRTSDLETEIRVGLSSLLRALDFTDKATRYWVEAATAIPLDLDALADARDNGDI
ncbi:MAG: TetR/AcrR family transcriptional regulator [Actinomycetia bacterium]|nr:TetR/AcrR family transcriptional regulator [Actinomycetes bacterium]MCP4958302.1 TetR/AcrR family transcriptional regulator [Actinomycetes bacterium]